MRKLTIQFPELLYIFSFLLYLLGSAITLIEHGVELSLWLMTFAAVLTLLTTVFPWLGFKWLKLGKKGSQLRYGLALFLQAVTLASFAYAMSARLNRDLPRFYSSITFTTLLWAIWLLIFIYSRHAYHPTESDDKLNPS
jgi:signal transduction histidine kinase